MIFAVSASRWKQQGRHDEAFKVFDRAVQFSGRGAPMRWRTSTARPTLWRVTSVRSNSDPRHAHDAYGRARLLKLRRLDETLTCLNLCDQLQPNQATILEHRAMALHDLRRFEEALADGRRAHALEGRTILIYSNEGSGDMIQFARFVPMLSALGARAILVALAKLQIVATALAIRPVDRRGPVRGPVAGVATVAASSPRSVRPRDETDHSQRFMASGW